jgi:large subunit ribosomal protein L35
MRITKSGKVKHFKAGRGHLLTGKSSKRKRLLGKAAYVSKTESATMKLLLPYGA